MTSQHLQLPTIPRIILEKQKRSPCMYSQMGQAGLFGSEPPVTGGIQVFVKDPGVEFQHCEFN